MPVPVSSVYRNGHLGVALVLFAPVGATLVVVGKPAFAYLAGVAMLWLAMLPDVDHRLPGVSHRGVTHTLSFALAVGAALGAAGAFAAARLALADPVVGGVVGFSAGALSVLAHLLADLLTPAGVPILWPLSSRRYSLELVCASNRIANTLLLLTGVFVAVTTLVVTLRYGPP
jgi:inner membrane protein